jgi:hypothetical protein
MGQKKCEKCGKPFCTPADELVMAADRMFDGGEWSGAHDYGFCDCPFLWDPDDSDYLDPGDDGVQP